MYQYFTPVNSLMDTILCKYNICYLLIQKSCILDCRVIELILWSYIVSFGSFLLSCLVDIQRVWECSNSIADFSLLCLTQKGHRNTISWCLLFQLPNNCLSAYQSSLRSLVNFYCFVKDKQQCLTHLLQQFLWLYFTTTQFLICFAFKHLTRS